MNLTRRRLLSVTAVVGTGVLAGCTDGRSTAGSEPNETTSQASFFVFWDLTEQVADETATTDLLVPLGQHGHGWEPGPSVREDIRNADLFVHGMTGFQPWVDDIKTDLEVDGADVTTIDVSAGLDLLEAGGGNDHGEHEEGHDGEQDEEQTEEHDDEHDHGSGMDPHFWMDPLRVKEATGNVRQAFVDLDSDNADAYTENAETFRAELDSLHEQIEELLADASKGVLLVAGHDSLQYFSDRYGVTVEALTNVSPDDRPTPRDIERAQEVIDTHDLQYICADPLESQQAANQLVEETDVEEVLPLTAIPGLTEEWESEDWGYVDLMKNVNLPTLERALDA